MVRKSLADSKIVLLDNKEKLKAKEKVKDKLKNELDELLALDKFDQDIAELSAKCQWVDVAVAQDVSDEITKKIDEKDDKINRLKAKLTKLENNFDSLGSSEERSKAVEDVEAEANQTALEAEKAKKNYAVALRGVTSAQERCKQISDVVESLSKNVSRLKDEVRSRRLTTAFLFQYIYMLINDFKWFFFVPKSNTDKILARSINKESCG